MSVKWTGRRLKAQPGAIDRQGLAGMHELVIDLLAELGRAVEVIGVPMYLAYGTLLGAARDGDLIPWDVDADVWVEQRHMQRLLRELPQALGPRFELITPDTHRDYEFLFPRLAIKGVSHVFVRVDIFPLDPAPRSSSGRRAYLRIMRLLDRAYFVKLADTAVRSHYSRSKRSLILGLKAVLSVVPAAALRHGFRALQRRGDAGVLTNSCGAYGRRELLSAAWFTHEAHLRVRGVALQVPGSYDAVLTHLYGDWRTPVSPEQQAHELAAATSSFVVPLQAAGVLSAPEEGP